MADRTHVGRMGILWRGNPGTRDRVNAANSRLSPIFDALAERNIAVEPVVYSDEIAGEVREQLLALDGVLVWVDPISNGEDRSQLDPLLHEMAAKGIWVSAHPKIILKMGTKEVLFRTQHLGWGTDTAIYNSEREFREQFPSRLASAGPRVLKQYRGNGGNGVWKVELDGEASVADLRRSVRVLHALRGSVEEEMRLGDFLDRCRGYFAGPGQDYRPGLPAAAFRRDDPLLPISGRSGRLRTPADSGADAGTAARIRARSGAAGASHHARTGGAAVPSFAPAHGS